MADDEKTSSKTIHRTTAAAVTETPLSPYQEGNRGASASVAAAVATAATGRGDTTVRKPRTAASASYLRPSSPSCGNESRKSSSGSRKTGSRHSSRNSRKSSTNNVNGSRNTSGGPVDTDSAALLLCKGSICIGRNCNSRFSGSSGAVSGTITARKCVGCAAGRENIPVVCNAIQRRKSGSDARDDAPLPSAALSPSTFTGTVLSASGATHSAAGGLVLSIPSRVQQQQQQQNREEQHRQGHQQQEQAQSQQQQQPEHKPEQELQLVQQKQHKEERQQQPPSREPVQTAQTQVDNKQEQQNMASTPQLRFPVAPRVDVIHGSADAAGPTQRRSPFPVSLNSLLHRADHHTHHHQQHQLQLLPNAQTLQLPVKQLQHQLVQHPEPQERQQDLHLLDQKLQSKGLKQEAQQVLQPEHHLLSFDDSMTTRFEMLSITGGNTSMSDASVVYAAAAAAQRDGVIISFPKPEENRRRLIPAIHARGDSELALSNRTPVQQQQQQQQLQQQQRQHQVDVETSNYAALQRSTAAVHQFLSSNAAPSPSVAAIATTPHIRLAAASKRHRPPPCTAVPAALPRCSVSTPGAYPEMPSIPVLNSEFDATAAATGEACLSPAAAAILRGAASAAAAAAAAATDAASLVIDPPQESSGTTTTRATNTAVTGAARRTPLTPAPTLVPTTSHSYLAEPLATRRRNPTTESSVGIPKSIPQATADTTQAQQRQTNVHQQHQHFTHYDHYHNHNRWGSTVSSAADAENLLRPTSASRSVSVQCNGSKTSASIEHSNIFNGNSGRAKEPQKLHATTLCQPSPFQDAAVMECDTFAGVDTPAAPFPQEAEHMEMVRDLLPAASVSAFKNRTPGRSTPNVATVAVQALAHRAAPTLSASNTTRGGAAESCSFRNISAPGTPTKVSGSTTSTGTRAVSGTPRTPAADGRETAVGTASDAETTVIGAPMEKEQVQPAATGSETAGGSAARSLEPSDETAAKGGARATLLTGVDRQPRGPGVRVTILRPLQLPESPRSNSGTGGGGSTPVGTAGDTAATKCVSPTSTPGTPQNRHQLQQLLMHRTPAPQDRPRRPAAATAAGVVVRRGGPINMWGIAAATDPAVALAAAENGPGVSAAEVATVPCLEASADATACVSTGSAALRILFAAGEETVALESPHLPEELQAGEKQQPDSGNALRKVFDPPEELHIEERQQSGDSQEREDTNIRIPPDSKPTVTPATSAAEQRPTDRTLHADDISSVTEDTGEVWLAETHQQRERKSVAQLQELQRADEEGGQPSPPQQQHQLEQCQRELEEQQTVENSDEQRKQIHDTDVEQQALYDCDAALQQKILLELWQQDGCQSPREKQQSPQPAMEKRTTEHNEQSLPLRPQPPAGDRAAAASVEGAPPSSAWTFLAAEEEQQLNTVVADAGICPRGELVYFNTSDILHGSGSTTTRRNRKRNVKQHSSSSTDRSEEPSNQVSNDGGGLRSKSSRSGSRSARRRTESNKGDDPCSSNCPELTYFPFSQEQGLSLSSLIGGDNQRAAPAGGIPVSHSNSATWQIHAQASDVDAALLSGRQQQDSGNLVAALEWQSLNYHEGRSPLEQACVSKDESDVEDNLPLSAAAMAAAFAVTPSSRLSGSAVAARGRRETKPERGFHSSSPQDSPYSNPLLEEGSLQYSMPAPVVVEHGDTPWATRSSWGSTLHLNSNQDDKTNKNKALPQHIGNICSSSRLPQTAEGEPLSHLKERFEQPQRLEHWENQQLSDQLLQLRSCCNTGAGPAAGRESVVERRRENSHRSNPALRGLNAPTSTAPGTTGAALPRGWDSRTMDSCSASYRSTTFQGNEQQPHRHVRTSAGLDASFYSREFVPPALSQQEVRQQQDLLAPQQQILNGETPMPRRMAPSSAAALRREGYPLFCAPPSLPTAETEPDLQQALQQQNLHLLRGSGKLSSFSLRQASGDETAAAFDVSVATGKPALMYTARGEAVLVTSPHECTRQFQQSLQQQQQVQSLQQQQLLLRQSQQQQQQVAHMRQPLNPVSRSRPHSPQLLQTQLIADASGGVVSSSSNRRAVLVPPSSRQQESLDRTKFPSSAVTHSDRRSSSGDPHSHSPCLRRVVPGAAAAALAAAAGGVTTAIGTVVGDAAASGADVLPGVHQEASEVFCPFRRTVGSRRAPSNTLGNSSSGVMTAPAAGAQSGEEMVEVAGEERYQSISSNRSCGGTSRKRFLGGTKRLFGGVKMHAAAANRSNKLLSNCEPAASIPEVLLGPQQASHANFNSRCPNHTPTLTPRGDPLERHFPVSLLDQQPIAGLQSTVATTQPHLVDMRLQRPLSTLSQQQPVSPLSHQQTQGQHSPRADEQWPYHLLPDSTLAYSTFVAQHHPQGLPMPEQRGQQYLGRGSSVSMLLRERVPSRYSHRSAKAGLPRRGKSCSSTFLCETIPGSRNGLAIASLRRGNQPGYGRSRNSSLPRLPCMAGRLLLAGGRVVGEVGQAAVDVGSTVVKELASVLHQSFKNILDMEEDSRYTEKREYYSEEHRCIRSNSLCIPVSAGRSRCDSPHLRRQKWLPYSSDPVPVAVQPRHVACCSTEEQLQHNLWMQRELSRDLAQQQEQFKTREEIQHQQKGSWRLEQQTRTQQSGWGLSHSCPQQSEEQQQCDGVEQRRSKEGPSPRAWSIATEERLGGLWLPKLDSECRSPSQPGRRSAAEAKVAQQQVLRHNSEQKVLGEQQLKWPGEDQLQDGGGRQDILQQQRQRQEQSVIPRHVKYGECTDIPSRYPGSEQPMEEGISPAASSAYRRMNSDHHTLQNQGGHLQSGHSQQLEKNSQDQTSTEQSATQKDVPVFPKSLQWGEDAASSSLPHSLLHSMKQRVVTVASDTRKCLEQQEARDRLVRLAASANISNNRLIESKSLPARQPLVCSPLCWAACEADKQRRHLQQEAGVSSTTNANTMAFQQEHDNSTKSGDRHSALQPLSPSLCENGLSGSNRSQLFRTGEDNSSTAFREPRKGTSTFGRPELMRQYDGEQNGICLSDDGSNCSTRNSYKEDDRALRDVSVETLSPRVNPLQETSQREALNDASAVREGSGDGTPLQQREQVHTRGSQQRQENHQHDSAVHDKPLDTPSRAHVRTLQESHLSLRVQGIASTKQPFGRHPQPFSLPPGRPLQRKEENTLSMPYCAGMRESKNSHAKLEACDRIVQRWRERATRNLAESLAAGTRRGR